MDGIRPNKVNNSLGWIWLFIVVVGLGMLLGFYLSDHPAFEKKETEKRELDDKYKYDLEKYKGTGQVPATYKEVYSFKTGIDGMKVICINNKGLVYAGGKGGVKIFSQEGKEKELVNSETGITALAVSAAGVVYIAGRDWIIFEKQKNLAVFGKKGKGEGEFEYITSLALSDKFLFVADAGNRRVCKFTLDGKFLGEIGKKEEKTGAKGFVIPSPHMDLAVSKDGCLWVANTGALQLEKYSFDGKFLESWGTHGVEIQNFIGCCNPANFAIDNDGNLITSEKGVPRIKKYSPKGKLLELVAPPSAFNDKCEYMSLAVDSKNRVYALDSVQESVRVFERK